MESLIVEILLPKGRYHLHNIYVNPSITNWKPEVYEQPDLKHDKEFTIHELNRVLQVNKKSAAGSDGVHRSMLYHTDQGPDI